MAKPVSSSVLSASGFVISMSVRAFSIVLRLLSTYAYPLGAGGGAFLSMSSTTTPSGPWR